MKQSENSVRIGIVKNVGKLNILNIKVGFSEPRLSFQNRKTKRSL